MERASIFFAGMSLTFMLATIFNLAVMSSGMKYPGSWMKWFVPVLAVSVGTLAAFLI